VSADSQLPATRSADRPYPPIALANRVLRIEHADDPILAYEVLGAGTKEALVGLLPAGWSFEGKRVLDFGCGAGRTLRHFLAEAEVAEIWGVDIDGPSIDWLQGSLCPPLHAMRGPREPPVDLAAGTFDLVWAISVFTHLTDTSLPWLAEMHRLLRPGGLLIATYTGRWSSEELAGEPWDEDRIGMNVIHETDDWDGGGPTVLMSDWWVREHWGRGFEIIEVLPEHHRQTWAVLRRRGGEIAVEELALPSDDPREQAALRHNVRQLLRRSELAHRLLAQTRSDYESTASWRLTKPLRSASRIVRSIGGR
jgi:SAM-dependent methyltransferase